MKKFAAVLLSLISWLSVESAAMAQGSGFGVTIDSPSVLHSYATNDSGNSWYPHLATDRAGTWIIIWESYENVGGVGIDEDILFSRSTNNGASWSDPAALNSNAVGDIGNDWYPELVTDNKGTWIAAWTSEDPLGGVVNTDFDIFFSRSMDNGETWSGLGTINANANVDFGNDELPRIATDSVGNWVVIWESNENLGGLLGADDDIFVSRSTDNGDSWSAPVELNTNASSDSRDDEWAHLTTDGKGYWIAVWQSEENLGGLIGNDDDILVSRSVDNGATWTPPAILNSNAGGDTGADLFPKIATDKSGNWITIWYTEQANGGMAVSRSLDNGATWSEMTMLNPNAGQSGIGYFPQVTTDYTGNWLAAWSSSKVFDGSYGDDFDIFGVRSIDNGATWSVPAALNTNATTDAGDDFSPFLATDVEGNWVIAWDSNENLDGADADQDIFFSRFFLPIRAHTNVRTMWHLYK